jgi:hypothetical protein
MNPRHHPAQECVLRGSSGAITAKVGDRFADDGLTWEIVAFSAGGLTYSPDSLGGTPGLFCKVVEGEITDWWKKWQEPDGTVEWCGDSVAVCMMAAERVAS